MAAQQLHDLLKLRRETSCCFMWSPHEQELTSISTIIEKNARLRTHLRKQRHRRRLVGDKGDDKDVRDQEEGRLLNKGRQSPAALSLSKITTTSNLHYASTEERKKATVQQVAATLQSLDASLDFQRRFHRSTDVHVLAQKEAARLAYTARKGVLHPTKKGHASSSGV